MRRERKLLRLGFDVEGRVGKKKGEGVLFCWMCCCFWDWNWNWDWDGILRCGFGTGL